jgi:UDPglucose--hexose-1-phosphate uridylyltransferase
VSSPISFRIIESESTFLDPRKNFQPHTERFQVRFDPLTGRSGHLSHFGALKAQPLDLEKYGTPEVKGFCPFCGEARYKATPRFSEKVVPEGRLARGEALLIPNLFPYDVHSTVLIMTDEHVVPLADLDERRLFDSLSLGIDFLKRIALFEPSLPYHVMTWNYMPPSGGGLVHPHQQYFATATPGNQFIDELRAAEEFQQRNGKDYWSLLIKEEKRVDERYIGEVAGLSWLASFVPLGLLGDMLAVLPGIFSIKDCGPREVRSLASGLSRLFRYFTAEGIFSFNAAWFFGPPGQSCFPSHFRIIPRTFLNLRDYAPDLSFFQSLLQEPISVVRPEELCRTSKGFFVD